MKRHIIRLFLGIILLAPVAGAAQSPALVFDADPQFRFRFGGVVGQRVAANTSDWLIRMPAADPGLLAMFELRDRQPTPNLVPWAGEFVGKYLISAIQATRLDNDPKLLTTVSTVIRELLRRQAEDGYLGPFPQADRLLKNWDLWGHYHVMLALLMWHEQTGDAASLQACRKAADLVCATYLDTGRRPREAGSSEMNLAIIHALGRLYRTTREERYLRMMRVIEEDWELEGDYLRTALAGLEFYQTPKPRWESLPDLQGLLELYLITGDDRYRTALLHHWDSIRRLDRRNTGGFSSGEQATGTPYEPTAIETCCTIAWMALTVDVLRLTGNPAAADELELSTFNGMLGAQHPSGSWWTYSTPMDGVREASHHTIVFQSRAGTPDLNCCSVNGPRGIGMLSEWAVMRAPDGLAVNYYGPQEAHVQLADGTPVTLRQETRYPLDGTVKVQVQLREPREFTLHLRIPAWSATTGVRWAGSSSAQRSARAGHQPSASGPTAAEAGAATTALAAEPGTYLPLRRRWASGDLVELQFDMSLRYESGGGEMAGRMSVYRGPLLLAYDLGLNENGPPEPAPCAPSDLANARFSFPAAAPEQTRVGCYLPWLIADVPRGDGSVLRLCDFASAGARGTRYVSWLPAEAIAPPPPHPEYPDNNATVPPGRLLFRMRRATLTSADQRIRVQVSANPDMRDPVLDVPCEPARSLVIADTHARVLQAQVAYFWRLVAENPWGRTSSPAPPRQFMIDPALPPLTDEAIAQYGENAAGVVVQADLHGAPEPAYGRLGSASGWAPGPGPQGAPDESVELDGSDGLLVYPLRAFPESEYTVALRCSVQRVSGALGQVLSAWCHGMDDPLRICVHDGKLYARVEAGMAYSTRGVPIEQDVWYDLCVVKRSSELTLFVDGRPVETIQVPAVVLSAARDVALGGNPHYAGGRENLPCRIADFVLQVRPWSPEEVAQWHENRAK